MTSAVSLLQDKLTKKSAVAHRPERASFEEFLRHDAKVPCGGGEHGPYSFQGREVILLIVRLMDQITSQKITDASLAIAGGAQWGKTVLELNYAAYCTSQLFLNFGLYLPNTDLVDGIVDTKLRPDVIDQIPYFAEMVSIGRAINKSGKAVNRKGAFTVTDGPRKATGMVLGLNRVPTSFTFDVTAQDEKDDIKAAMAKFVRGRRTSSSFRFSLIIGTQRVYGRGQHQAWKDGSQGVIELGGLNPEEAFPGIIRCAVHGTPHITDPKLTWAGDFRNDDKPDFVVATHTPDQLYYLADPVTGQPLDRTAPVLVHRNPGQIAMRNWSIRVSQLSIDAIGLSQIVGQFQLAVNDPEEMTVFRCDVLALPQSTAQALTPSIIERAQKIDPFDMRLKPEAGRAVYAGIDVGDRCYFIARERENAQLKRLIYATTIASADLVTRGQALVEQFGVQCLFIDQRPEADLARSLALALNGLNALQTWPAVPDKKEAYLSLGGLTWNGPRQRWQGLRCAVVRFDKKQIGAGIEHDFDIFEEGGHTKFVPVIKCNRQDSIDKVVREFLTPDEGVVEYFDGKPRIAPAMLLPRSGGNRIIETVTAHLITGSEREKLPDGTKGDYVDQCANHFLLADAYSAMAEGEGIGSQPKPFKYKSLTLKRGGVMEKRLNRRVLA